MTTIESHQTTELESDNAGPTNTSTEELETDKNVSR